MLQGSRVVRYLGCGCGAGPSALSLPAAAVCALLFGPAVAAVRWAAALASARVFESGACTSGEPTLPETLLALLPPAAFAALGSFLEPALLSLNSNPLEQFGAGLLAGFVFAPCGLGAVTFAAAVRGTSGLFAAAFLCIAGICDARAVLRAHAHARGAHDGFAYAILALACGLAALRGGAHLVHPYLAAALGGCAMFCAWFAYAYRAQRCTRLRIAPALMLAGIFQAAPPPAYHATETTLAQPFPGERVDFTGLATQTGAVTTVVRYAITCCRADAAPEVVRLEQARPRLRGWVRASGVLEMNAGGFALRVTALVPVAPPADPFVYR